MYAPVCFGMYCCLVCFEKRDKKRDTKNETKKRDKQRDKQKIQIKRGEALPKKTSPPKRLRQKAPLVKLPSGVEETAKYLVGGGVAVFK